ncbi:MAG: C-GCAxxG-C-C family protein [Lachnospiraceae bacterium]|nr:C-GCAxxG-C-C family protein [Lachnospiraceae bacterium]
MKEMKGKGTMSKYYDKAVELRAIVTPHYNCAQSVVLPFAKDAGVSDEVAYQVASNFGAGMKRASVCGAITGGLMALGLFGVDDPQTISAYHRALAERHQSHMDCADLLRTSKEQGMEKKPHCDGMVYECVNLVEEILHEKGKL